MIKPDKILTLFIVLMPILNSYTTTFGKGIGLSIVQLLFPFVILAYFFIKRKISLDLNWYFVLFCIYLSIVQIVFTPSLKPTDLISASVVAFLFSLAVCSKNVDCRLFVQAYRIAVGAAVIVFLFQEITMLLYGERIDGIIDGIPLMANPLDDKISYVESLRKAPRSSSLFMEPSHVSEYFFPLLAIELFSKSSFKINIRAIFLTVILIFLRSGNAILGLVILWSFWSISKFKVELRRLNVVHGLLFFIIAFILIRAYVNSDLGFEMINRYDNINDSHSSYMRIFRGYMVYGGLPLINQLFGMNAKTLENILTTGTISNLFGEGETYLNTTQHILIVTGLVGYLLFLFFLFSLYKRSSLPSRAILIVFFVFSFTSSNYLSISMLFYFVIIFMVNKIDPYTKPILFRRFRSPLVDIKLYK